MAKLENRGVGRITRREALALGAAGAGLGISSMLGGTLVSAQTRPKVLPPPRDPNSPGPPTWKTEFRELAPNFFAYIQGDGPPNNGSGISTACVLVGADDLMVFDALGGPLMAEAFIRAIRGRIGHKPFGRLVYTHHHRDHVDGGQYFMDPPIEVVAAPYCRQRVVEMAASAAGGPPDPAYGDISPTFPRQEGRALGGEKRNLCVPTTTITDRATYYIGDTVVELIHPGVCHTWGDLLVYLPEFKTLFMGDIGSFHMAPFSHNGHITKWIAVLENILDMDVETIIPGHRPVAGKQEVAEMVEYFRLLEREARKRFDSGMSAGKAAAEIRMGKFDNWMGSERILLNLYRLYSEFNGTLTPIVDVTGLRAAAAEYNTIMRASTPSAALRPPVGLDLTHG